MIRFTIQPKIQTMKGFKQCEKNHFYKEDMDECPYCPKGTVGEVPETVKTSILDDNQDNSTKTVVFGGETPKEEKNTKKNFDPNRTIVTPTKVSDDSEKSDEVQISKRKLRGWLVTFDIEEFGTDYKIFEGRNLIGKKSTCDITVLDNEVSSEHAVILFRKDKFEISDQMSTNGTLVNGELLESHKPNVLVDGDEIVVGKTSLLFKTATK